MRLRYFLPLLATMVLACSHETPMAPDRSASDGSDVLNGAVRELPLDQVDKMLDLKGLADSPDGGVAAMSRGSNTVHIPSGSVDALSGALAAAGPRGTVILEPGLHTESGTVTISAPVTLIGLEGVESGLAPVPATTMNGLVWIT